MNLKHKPNNGYPLLMGKTGLAQNIAATKNWLAMAPCANLLGKPARNQKAIWAKALPTGILKAGSPAATKSQQFGWSRRFRLAASQCCAQLDEVTCTP